MKLVEESEENLIRESTITELFLVVGGNRLDLSHVGPGSVMIRRSEMELDSQPATLFVSVDGDIDGCEI